MLAFFGGGCAGSPTLSDSTVLRVGSDLANPPFIEEDSDGEPAGRDVEMLEDLVTKAGAVRRATPS